jgi:membrane protease YdiL (CAAX protease family)
MYIILGVAGIVISLPEIKEGGRLWKEHPVKNMLWVLIAYVATQVVDNLLIIPYGLLYADQESTMNESNIAVAAQQVTPVVFVIALGVLGPIVEETVYRLILTYKGSAIVPKILAVTISSLAFGLIHLHAFTLPEFLSILPHIGGGVFLSILMLKQKNVILLYAVHILINLPGLIFLVMSIQ